MRWPCERWRRRACPLPGRSPTEWERPKSLYWLANITSELGDPQTGLQLFEDALRLATELDYGTLISGIQNDLAEVLRAAGKYEQAEPLYEQSLAYERHAGTHHGIAMGLLNLAMVSIQQGKLARGRQTLEEGLALIAESPYATFAERGPAEDLRWPPGRHAELAAGCPAIRGSRVAERRGGDHHGSAR